MDLGAPELIIVLVVVLLLFGGSKLPDLARSLGRAQSEFKKGLAGGSDEAADSDDPTPTQTPEPEDHPHSSSEQH